MIIVTINNFKSPVVTEHTVAKSAVIPLKQQQLEAMSLQENKDDTQQELSSSLTYHGGRPLSLRAISFKKQSVKGTNTISERDFGKFDRLLREKPNATTLSLEAVILFSNNKTAKWLCETPACESKELLQKARACAPEFRKLYHSRKKALFEERAKILQQKELALQQLQEKSLKEKEKTNCGYNGKWSVAEQTR